MNGILAQQIALASFANGFLKTGTIPENFCINNSTFQFCKSVQFFEFKKAFFSAKTKEKLVAPNPILWLELLRAKGCKKVRLRYQHSKNEPPFQDYKLAGFVGGGGTWLIEAIFPTYSNFWANKWEVADRNAPDKKVWSVKYVLVAKQQPTSDLKFDLVDIKNELFLVLTQIRDFAKKHQLTYWFDIFNNSIIALNADTPNENYYHKDLVNPESYTLNVQQLLFSAANAFVFGGMGSWNDLSFELQEDNEFYEMISSRLYNLINKVIEAGMNDC